MVFRSNQPLRNHPGSTPDWSQVYPFNQSTFKYALFLNLSLVDDASSGYDSTDTSDSESVSSQESRQSTTDRTSFCADKTEVLKVRSTHALSEDLKMILSLPEICDVTFLVGPTETQVHGVRAILAMRSRLVYPLSLHLSLSVCLSACLPVYLSICLCLSVCVSLSVCLSLSLSLSHHQLSISWIVYVLAFVLKYLFYFF